MMDTNEQLSALFAAALEQHEAAKAAINDLAQERKALTVAVEAIQIASNHLKKSSLDIEKKYSTKKEESTPLNSLYTVTSNSKNNNIFTWKSFIFITVLILIIINTIENYIIINSMFPSQSEINELRSEKYKLELNIINLTKQGGKIKFNTCDGRICIEASENQGKSEQKWNGAAWRYIENGTPLVIPNGY